ncbi:MAG: ADP-forming succinate--CoA ligase subunit beta [Dehalococcoidia bacterium]|nr:ADP-forming succinate--CoA ligase subunit beta [Dehalococcoidia bacterium]
MKIHEYQAKQLLKEYGVPVPNGGVATTAREAGSMVESLAGKAVIKAQVHAGGRGKAGGVKVVSNRKDAEAFAAGLLGKRLVTHQSGPEGAPVDKLLVEEALGIAQELYASIVIEPSVKSPVLIISAAGGMEIEEVAAKTPEKILTIPIDPIIGFQPYMGRKAAYSLGLPTELIRPAGALFASLYKAFEALDCTLVEINPLVVTTDKRILAADAKIAFDDDAMYRHADLAKLRDTAQEDKLDVEASKADVNYIRLDGDVGCMVNGAGLAMATMDIIKYMGAQPANFLDVGGGATEEQVTSAFTILLSDPKVKKVLVNIFGGILRCDVAARGIINAVKAKGINVPLIVRMRGTNAEEAKAILQASGLKVTILDSLQDAAAAAVKAA